MGIAADELLRHFRELPKNVEHPLFDWGITEADALRYCRSKGFDFCGLYDKFKSLGCWCCPLSGEVCTADIEKGLSGILVRTETLGRQIS